MFTVKAWMSHMSKPKMYYFTKPEDAESFADQCQLARIPATLGYQKSIMIDEVILPLRQVVP